MSPAVSGSVAIGAMHPPVIGPAGRGMNITNKDIQPSSKGSFTRDNVEYPRFNLNFRSRDVPIDLTAAAAALPTLASAPVLGITNINAGRHTITISNIPSGATHWELYESADGVTWPTTPFITKEIAMTSEVRAVSSTTHWRARTTAENRLPSAYSNTVTATIAVTPLLINDDLVTNINLALGGTGSLAPALLANSEGVGAKTWSLTKRTDDANYNKVSQELSTLMLSDFSTTTGSYRVRLPMGLELSLIHI